MFSDLKILETYQVNMEKICRFVLTVRKNYRPLPYHNFSHGVNVANQMYKFIKMGCLDSYLEPSEMVGLFIACLCHDIDHRGRSNGFFFFSEYFYF